MHASVETRVALNPGSCQNRGICLFVSYSPDCTIKPHVAHHLKALSGVGFDCILLLVTDSLPNKSFKRLGEGLAGLIVRRNEGYDFGAWADAFRLFPGLWEAERVLLVNDSVIGPIGDFAAFAKRLLAVDADLVGLTEALEGKRHFQSYFLLQNRRLLRNARIREFWGRLDNLPTRQQVIDNYELAYTGFCVAQGLREFALFPAEGGIERGYNPTLAYGEKLLERGFPYVKVQLVRDLLDDKGRERVKAAMRDENLASFVDALAKPSASAPPSAAARPGD